MNVTFVGMSTTPQSATPTTALPPERLSKTFRTTGPVLCVA